MVSPINPYLRHTLTILLLVGVKSILFLELTEI